MRNFKRQWRELSDEHKQKIRQSAEGKPSPSLMDIQFTSGLKKACNLMDIQLLDHIIFTEGSFFSFSADRTFNRQ